MLRMRRRRSIHPRILRGKSCVYSSLNEDAQEIRLLTILPGTFDSKIRVTLETKSFNKNSGLSFEALSYAWGSTDNPVDIFVRGLGSQETITVTRNLAEALPYLRYQDKGRVVWIDAICVNQQDVAERGSQVRRMADIYQSASRVIVWLGLESHDSARAIECCEKLSSNIIVDWGLQTMSSVSTDTSLGRQKRVFALQELRDYFNIQFIASRLVYTSLDMAGSQRC